MNKSKHLAQHFPRANHHYSDVEGFAIAVLYCSHGNLIILQLGGKRNACSTLDVAFGQLLHNDSGVFGDTQTHKSLNSKDFFSTH